MDVDQSLLLKVRNYLRISHSALDDDLSDTIIACLEDLRVCGVKAPTPIDPQDIDPLILNAIKLYCRKEYTDDPAKAEAYQARYDSLKSCLMMASKYREGADE